MVSAIMVAVVLEYVYLEYIIYYCDAPRTQLRIPRAYPSPGLLDVS